MAGALNDPVVIIQEPQSTSSFLSTSPSAPNSSLVSLKAINATFSNHSTRVKDQAWDKAVLAEHERLSLDCAKHIDPDWYRWMSEHPVQPSDVSLSYSGDWYYLTKYNVRIYRCMYIFISEIRNNVDE